VEQLTANLKNSSDETSRIDSKGQSVPRYCIAGTWIDWQITDMKWDPEREGFYYMVRLGKDAWESFQIMIDGHWHLCIHPDCADACPHKAYTLCGPDHDGHGKNWTVGRHALDKGNPGACYEVRVALDGDRKVVAVDWEPKEHLELKLLKGDNLEVTEPAPRAPPPAPPQPAPQPAPQPPPQPKKKIFERLCATCGEQPGEKKDNDGSSAVYCKECYQSGLCWGCRNTRGFNIDKEDRLYCGSCWEKKLCKKCQDKEGDTKDRHGDLFCPECWFLYRLCRVCEECEGVVFDDDEDPYCQACWKEQTICAQCQNPGGSEQDANGDWFCEECMIGKKHEIWQEACRLQENFFRDLLRVSLDAAGPSWESAGEWPPECNLDVEVDSPGWHFVAEPTRSTLQGTCFVGDYEFTSDFDGGNALCDSWKLESEDNGIPTFSAEIAHDFKATTNRTKNFWFNFGVRPLNPKSAARTTIRIVMHRMSKLTDLLDNGYAPVCYRPSAPSWQRIESGLVTYQEEQEEGGKQAATIQLIWLHQFRGWEDADGTTYFAFCYPFSYVDLQIRLARIQQALKDEADLSTDLGRLHQPRQAFGSDANAPALVVGKSIYFHRQLVARTPAGRAVEMLTITEAPSAEEILPQEELPGHLKEALSELPSAPPLHFKGRKICFVSARVHPGETPGQFALLGLLEFLLSDDPRAILLRQHTVFKLVPMLNPDGVAWGHTRTNSLGFDLNRCYENPIPEQHEGVAAVKGMLDAWAERGDLWFYMDCHAHVGIRGCFLYGNWAAPPAPDKLNQVQSVLYAHLVQANCPHLDIDKCMWSTAPAPSTDKPHYDSGRGQIGRSCNLCHAFTLECNYNLGWMCRPVTDAPRLPEEGNWMQQVRGEKMSRGGRFAPVFFTPCAWAAVGEAIAVSLLDIDGKNPFSRVPAVKRTALVAPVSGESAHQAQTLIAVDRLWNLLAIKLRAEAGAHGYSVH